MPAVFTNAGLFTFRKLTDTQTLPTRSWFIRSSIRVCGHRTTLCGHRSACAVTELPCAVIDPRVRSPNCPVRSLNCHVRSPIRVCGHRTTMCGHRSANAIQQKLFPTQAVDNYNTFSSSSAMINVRGESLPHLGSVATQL